MTQRVSFLAFRAGTVLFLAPVPSWAAPVYVTGQVTIEPVAVVRGSSLEVSGRLTDDRGAPLRRTPVRVQVFPASGGTLRLSSLDPCSGASTPQRVGAELEQVTDDAGTFCLLVAPADEVTRVTVRCLGLLDFPEPRVFSTKVIAGQRPVTLSFAPEPRQLEVDGDEPRVWVRADAPGPDLRHRSVPLELAFAPERGEARPIAKTTVVLGERAALRLPLAELGGPGPGTLILRFPGDADLAAAQRSAVVQKSSRVALTLASPPTVAATAGEIRVEVAATGGGAPVPAGGIELLRGEQTVAAAPLADGRARLSLSVETWRGGTGLTARYLPDSPWWLPGDPLSISLPEPRPSPWLRWPWLLAGIAMAAWTSRTWRRPRRRLPQSPASGPLAPPGKPTVEVVGRGTEHEGWIGQVVDAHLGTPIAGAEVTILAPSFADSHPLARDGCGEDGRFALPRVDPLPEGARLRVAAQWHSAIEHPVPPRGELRVSLVTRRRTLLNRLVAWAEGMGRPWAWGGADPTPGQVASVARDRGNEAVEAWAKDVEASAFGADPVDDARERAVTTREPPTHGSR